MPGGLIAWGKSRFLKRKSPERAVHVVLPPEPSEANPRHVRFDDWRESQSPGRSNSALAVTIGNTAANRGPDWRYDDVRVQIAPMARQEDLDARERRAMSAPRNNPPPSSTATNGHAEYAPIAKEAFLDDSRNHLDDVNVVFLQRNDEVKRTMLPSEIRTMRQVQAAFCRAFNLSMGYLQQPYVRIYIQEPRGQLFYELDEPMDIRDKSVLRLKEAPCPSPASRLEYLSDAELGSSISSSIARPASAMAAFSPQNFGPPSKSSSSALYDPYDPYASDTASSHDSRSIPRSGSATPIIDREARVRMDTMERQLQGLSSLVHSALKGMDETSVRDMEILRRQVLNMRPERLPSEEPPSLPDSSMSSRSGLRERESRERDIERLQHTQHLAALRERVQQTATEMRQLRRVAQVNAQSSREIIRSAGDQILKLIAERLGRRAESVIPSRASDARKEDHSRQLSTLLQDLTLFERNVEEVRASVLNSNRKLRMSEVERLTLSLTDIGKNAANLKTAIPSVHGQSESDLLADIERLRGERNDATTAIDQSLRRCKALANIMVTMKKLAMVQDPAMQKIKQSSSGSSPSSSSSSNGTLPPIPPSHASTASSPTVPQHSIPPPPPSPLPASQSPARINGEAATIPPVPPSPVHYTSPTSSLDGAAALREIASTPPPPSAPPSAPTSAPAGPAGQPPRPPSRFSVRDARQRAPIPPQSPSLSLPPPSPVNGMAPQSSPILATNQTFDAEADNRRVRLEERQAALAEKQRMLHNQFAQLQQLTPN